VPHHRVSGDFIWLTPQMELGWENTTEKGLEIHVPRCD
jgi:hypothetical protein